MTKRIVVWTCQCGTQVKGGNECPDCNTMRPDAPSKARPTSSSSLRQFCICGSKLRPDQKCEETGMYPRMLQAKNDDGEWMFTPFHSPFVCPVCRERLRWDGSCYPCHGTKTGRKEDWNTPGDCYERHADGAHWELVRQGPMALPTREQVKFNVATIQALMAKVGTPPSARKPSVPTRVAEILTAAVPETPGPLPVTEDEW